MVNNFTFTFGNYSSEMVGLRLKTLPDEVIPKRKTEKLNILTRDGDLLRDFETYEPYTLTLDCYLVNNYTLDNIRKLKEMLSIGEGDLIFGWNPDKVYQARLISEVNFKEIIDYSATVQIQFEVQPYAKLKSGENAIDYSGRRTFTLVNQTAYTSMPVIRLIPKGPDASFYLNDVLVGFISLDEEIILDSEIEECYNDKGDNLNHFLDINSDFPLLKPGINTFEVISADLMIIPNFREL